MLVKEIMITDIISIDYDKSIFNTSQLYKEHKVGSILITEGGKCVGIVTERNIIERCLCEKKDPENTPISEIMTTDPITVHKLDSIEKAVDLMKTNNIKKLPVITEDEVVGIITMTDIAYARPDLSERFMDTWIKPRWRT